MELLTYSTDPGNELNRARLQLWSAKEVLAEANRTKDNAMKGRAMGYINRDRNTLRKIAHEMRTKLPPKKLYGITLAASTITVETKLYSNTRQDALMMARLQYGGAFSVARVEQIR